MFVEHGAYFPTDQSYPNLQTPIANEITFLIQALALQEAETHVN